ncbi:hypothetical protein ACFLU9_01890 [Chloroflexota bacterium]
MKGDLIIGVLRYARNDRVSGRIKGARWEKLPTRGLNYILFSDKVYLVPETICQTEFVEGWLSASVTPGDSLFSARDGQN